MSNFTTDPQNEVFDVVNENDEVVGEATRGEVHQNPDLIHRAVHIWLLNDKGEILRDISCAGHVQKGNTTPSTMAHLSFPERKYSKLNFLLKEMS